MGFEVTGIDPTPEIGFGEALPYPAGAFDHVICCDLLEHVP
jgi:hypothetical protein